MIFVTVGTQLPFHRLLDAMDAIAAKLDEEVVAQTADATATWPHLNCYATLDPTRFAQYFSNARVIVAHVGIGTVLSARRWQKPLVAMPRRFDLQEHRNDHQRATAKSLTGTPGLYFVEDAGGLDMQLQRSDLMPAVDHGGPLRPALIERLRGFVHGA